MSSHEAKPQDPPAAGEAPAAEGEARGKSRFKLSSKKIKIIGMLVGIMLVYAVVGHFLLPKPATESVADEELGEHGSEHAEGGLQKVEVELGDGSFSTTNDQAISGASTQLRFKLYVTVAESQEEEFKHLSEVHKNRVNEAVIEIFRAASYDDLKDPELNIMKQRVREKVNRLLGTTAIIDVIFSGFSKLEQ